MSFELSSDLDKNKMFITSYFKLEGRLDPHFYKPDFLLIINKLKERQARSLKSISVDIRKGIFDLSPEYYCKKGIPFIRVADIKEGTICFENTVYIDIKKHLEEVKTEYRPGDLVISKVGTIGEVSILPDTFDKYNISQNVVGLRLNESVRKILSPSFLQICLQTSFGIKQFYRQATTGVQPKITLAAIRNIVVPIPSKEMQERIVSKMKLAYSVKKQKEAEAQQLLDSIDDYLLAELGIDLPEQTENTLQSRIFTQTFKMVVGKRLDPIFYFSDLSRFNSGCYQSQPLKNVVFSFISGVGAGKQDQSDELNGIIQIRPTNIDRNGELIYDKNIYVPRNFKGEKIKLGDVLFNNTNSQELVGKTTSLKEDRELFFSNHITKISVFGDKVNSVYLENILNSYQRHKVFYSICTNWNNQSGVGLDLLKSISIPVPPMEKQTEIVNHIIQIRSQAKQLKQQAKAELEQAKKEVEAMILGDA